MTNITVGGNLYTMFHEEVHQLMVVFCLTGCYWKNQWNCPLWTVSMWFVKLLEVLVSQFILRGKSKSLRKRQGDSKYLQSAVTRTDCRKNFVCPITQ